MQKTDELVNTLVKAVDDIQNKKAKGYDTQATVTRIEGNTAYVHIPGGVDETPAQMTITAKKGDTVRVRVANGTAWLVGNATAPPTDDATANAAAAVATTASTMASDAIESANIAADAAESAKASAVEAKTWANEAKGEAGVANQAATNALRELSTVENVVDTLEWITAHGTMTLTSDVDIDPSHVYFVVDPTGQYVVGGTHYSIVEEPKQAELSTYYELTIDDAVTNYVATHIVVDTEGLWIVPDTNNANRVLIAHGNGNTYTTAGTYIIGTGGAILARFATNGLTIQTKDGNTTKSIAHLGYGSGNAETGTAQAPYYTIGIRVSNSALGNYSMAEGYDTTASAYCSHAEGKETTASGRYSHAEGGPIVFNGVEYSPIASGNASHAEGYGTTASGRGAHAEGEVTTASGDKSHAEGTATTASALNAHAEGGETTASGTHSHAEGYGTIASGFYSHAGGNYTTAGYSSQTVIGKYNNNKSADLFEVGNGTNLTSSNAFEVDTSGNVNIPSGAKYKINGTNLAAADVGAVPTSRTVNSKALSSNISLTASDVGALPNPSAGSVSEMGQYIDLHASGGAADYDVRLATNQATSTGGGLLHINGQPMRDFVIATETKTTTGLATSWTVRRWNSGYCEAYAKTNSTGYPMTNAYTNGYYYAATQALPSSVFTAVDYGQVDRCAGSSAGGLISASLYNLSTSQVQWYAFDTRSETVDCSFAIRIVGKWK